MRYSARVAFGKAIAALRPAIRGPLAAAPLAAALVTGAAWAAAGAVPAYAEPAIRVEGNQHIEAASIRTYFHAADGTHLQATELDAGLKALYATGLFADVRIRRDGDEVIATVVENPTLARVALEGNKKIKETQLEIDMRSKSGGPLWRPQVQEDVARMVDIYKRSGYFAARVEPKIITRSKERADLVFEINEGAKTGVKKIQFAGNHAYTADQLKGAIKTGETNILSFLRVRAIADVSTLATRGHLDFRWAASLTSEIGP